MKFNKLNIPTHWQNYWTRYPEGHTILEALISWVSQVDEMVDNQNTLNDNVEQFRSEIDEFIGKFDKRLQDEVTQTLKDWQNSGFLNVVINEALKWELDDFKATTEAQLQLKVGSGVKATPEDLSVETLELITGGTVEINSIPQDYSVKPIKTNFVNERSRNQFNGQYAHNLTFTYLLNDGKNQYTLKVATSGTVAIMPISGGVNQKIEKGAGGDRFIVASTESYPVLDQQLNTLHEGNTTGAPEVVTVLPPENHNYLVISLQIPLNTNTPEYLRVFDTRFLDEDELKIPKQKIDDSQLNVKYEVAVGNTNIFKGSLNDSGEYTLKKGNAVTLPAPYYLIDTTDTLLARYGADSVKQIRFDKNANNLAQFQLVKDINNDGDILLNDFNLSPGKLLTFGVIVNFKKNSGFPVNLVLAEYDEGTWLATHNLRLKDGVNYKTITTNSDTTQLQLSLSSVITNDSINILNVCGWFITPTGHYANHYIAPSDTQQGMSGVNENIVWLGDSLSQLKQLPHKVGEITGNTIYDVSFAGAPLVYSWNSKYNGTGVLSLSEQILTNDFTILDTALNEQAVDADVSEKIANANSLKSVNWSQIDKAVIFAGTNDIGSTQTSFEVFSNGIEQIITNLLSKNPSLQIYFITPTYRGDLSETSQPRLKQFVDELVAKSNSYGFPALNMLTHGGVNVLNESVYLLPDKLHQTVKGDNLWADKIAKFIVSN